jgi:hypothetical protein
MHPVEAFPVLADGYQKEKTTDVWMSTHVSITGSSNMRKVVIVNENHMALRCPLHGVLGHIVYAA